MRSTVSVRTIGAAALIMVLCLSGLPGCGGSSPSSSISAPPPPPPTFTIGGTVSGLATGNSVSILMSGGGTYQDCGDGSQETLTVTSNGSFTSHFSVQSGACYGVGVPTSPNNQQCHVLGALGTVNAANVTNVQVTCEQLLVLWNFTGPDGATPEGNLLQATDGNFYGTTAYGGSGPCAASPTDQYPSGCGTVFRITPAGAETVLWNFGNNPGDGQKPAAPLIQGGDGNFYGTTALGGVNGTGTVFKLTPDGTETVLWSFGETYSSDGNLPTAPLARDAAGNLYGITEFGGAHGEQAGAHGYGFGTVFRLTSAGTETILWSFGGHWGDGMGPDSLLLGADGNLYGTTYIGGEPLDYGTIFELTPAGTESVLWTFGKVSGDGLYPTSLIQRQDGNLYGTTVAQGGAGGGAMFQLTLPSLVYTNLVAFDAPSAAVVRNPTSLIQGHDGNFYGVTNPNNTCGDLFEVTPAADVANLWRFYQVQPTPPRGVTCDGPGYPVGLIQGSDGNLYGTTESSGATGYGTVFKLVP